MARKKREPKKQKMYIKNEKENDMKNLVITDSNGTEIYSRPLRDDDNRESKMWLLDKISDDVGIPVACLKIKVKGERK